jgi:hypothetical protein
VILELCMLQVPLKRRNHRPAGRGTVSPVTTEHLRVLTRAVGAGLPTSVFGRRSTLPAVPNGPTGTAPTIRAFSLGSSTTRMIAYCGDCPDAAAARGPFVARWRPEFARESSLFARQRGGCHHAMAEVFCLVPNEIFHLGRGRQRSRVVGASVGASIS